jgi:hypothetical protein
MERSSDFKDEDLTTGCFDSIETGSSIRCGRAATLPRGGTLAGGLKSIEGRVASPRRLPCRTEPRKLLLAKNFGVRAKHGWSVRIDDLREFCGLVGAPDAFADFASHPDKMRYCRIAVVPHASRAIMISGCRPCERYKTDSGGNQPAELLR